MIIAKIEGGLGNQMFQFAFAKALAVRKNVPLKLDISFFHNKHNATRREYLLPKFNIAPDVANI